MGRVLDLDSLIAFLKATHEIREWIAKQQEPEMARSWAEPDRLDFRRLNETYKQYMRAVLEKEERYNTVLDEGGKLLKQGHPASRAVIETNVNLLKTQWEFLLNLGKCFESHQRDAIACKEVQNRKLFKFYFILFLIF